MEIWKDIEGHEGFYQVSNEGNLRSLDRVVKGKSESNKTLKGRSLKSTITVYGYKVVVFCKNGKKENFRIHRLVAQSFLSNAEKKPLINHIDGDKTNNIVSNLEWCTHSENMKHAFATRLKEPSNPNKNGLTQGSKHHNSKLVEKEVMFIRKNARKNGGKFYNAELAREFNVSKVSVGLIVDGKTWKHVQMTGGIR